MTATLNCDSRPLSIPLSDVGVFTAYLFPFAGVGGIVPGCTPCAGDRIGTIIHARPPRQDLPGDCGVRCPLRQAADCSATILRNTLWPRVFLSEAAMSCGLLALSVRVTLST